MQRLFTIKKTQLQLVVDRGYVVPFSEAAIPTMTLAEFENYVGVLTALTGRSARRALSMDYRSSLLTTTNQITSTTKSMKVYFGGKLDQSKPKIPIEVVKEFTLELLNGKFNDEPARVKANGEPDPIIFTEAVLILDAVLSGPAANQFKMIKNVECQTFYDADLMYNPTRHVMTPRHELLSDEETEVVLAGLKVPKEKLLLIKQTDPVVKYYGWKVGKVIRVHRNDQSLSILTQKTINYRYIVNL